MLNIPETPTITCNPWILERMCETTSFLNRNSLFAFPPVKHYTPNAPPIMWMLSNSQIKTSFATPTKKNPVTADVRKFIWKLSFA